MATILSESLITLNVAHSAPTHAWSVWKEAERDETQSSAKTRIRYYLVAVSDVSHSSCNNEYANHIYRQRPITGRIRSMWVTQKGSFPYFNLLVHIEEDVSCTRR